MTAESRSTPIKSALFLGIAFAVTWSIVIGGWALGAHRAQQTAVLVLAVSMLGPAIAALVCAFTFEKGRRAEALGLRFKPNLWWLAAWLIPIAIAAASVAASILLGGRSYVEPGEGVIAMASVQSPEQAESLHQVPYLGLIVLGQALVLGAAINSVLLTFSEELGWRGYLHDLWRKAGFWRTSLGTGFVWGLWHAPMIYLMGHNYPDHRALGVGLFVIFCMLLSPIMTWVRDRAGSVFAAGIFHGTFNAVGGLTILTLSDAAFPWNGIVGIGGFVALALGVIAVAALQRGRPA